MWQEGVHGRGACTTHHPCVVGGMPGRGVHGMGACMSGGHVCQMVCMAHTPSPAHTMRYGK